LILLPRKDDNGKYRISYSQITSWKSVSAFNSILDEDGKYKNISGTTGYILHYFLDYEFPPSAMDIYAPFGQRVEDAICTKDYTGFAPEEIAILQKIEPLGGFQEVAKVDFGEFVLEGLIDDCKDGRKWLRDYKTVSKAKAQATYGGHDYKQLDVYALEQYFKTGEVPEVLEVVCIHRGGSHFKPPLKVTGYEIINRETDSSRLEFVAEYIRTTVREISHTYKIFLELMKVV